MSSREPLLGAWRTRLNGSDSPDDGPKEIATQGQRPSWIRTVVMTLLMVPLGWFCGQVLSSWYLEKFPQKHHRGSDDLMPRDFLEDEFAKVGSQFLYMLCSSSIYFYLSFSHFYGSVIEGHYVYAQFESLLISRISNLRDRSPQVRSSNGIHATMNDLAAPNLQYQWTTTVP
jgi:hypothetical protein